MLVGIIDYKYCSLHPIYNSIKSQNVNIKIIDNPKDIKKLDKLVFPGVGATNQIMSFLKKKRFINEIKEFALTGKNILGICAGMQILSTDLYENTFCKGLGFFDAKVIPIDNKDGYISTNIGWYEVGIDKKKLYYYFCHSYFLKFNECSNKNIIGSISLKKEIPAIVKKDNILGVQFHPEKSQTNGRELISKFINDEI